MTDNVLSGANALLTGILGVMGIWMTFHPPEQKEQRRWLIAFVTITFLGGVLAVWQGVRANSAQGKIESMLASQGQDIREIKKDSERPIHVTAPITVLAPDRPVATTPAAPRIVQHQPVNSPAIIGSGNQVSITSEVARRIPEQLRVEMVTELSKVRGKAKVTAAMNDAEAYDLATDIHEVLTRAGWQVDGPVLAFIASPAPLRGIHIRVHGEPVPPGGSVQIQQGHPSVPLARWITERLGFEMYAQRHASEAPDFVRVEVGQRPPKAGRAQ